MKNIEKTIQLVLLSLIAIAVLALVISLFSGKKTSSSAGVSSSVSGAGGKSTKPAGNGAVLTVGAVQAEPSSLIQTIRLNGDVSSRSNISLYADTVGKLVSCEAVVGSFVRRGSIVARVDPSRPGAPYAVSPVRSTIDGTITDLPYTVGETVSTSSPVAVVSTLDDLQIITHVPEKYIAVLKTGLSAEVSLVSYPGETFPARISMVSPVVDSNSRTVEIRLDIDDPNQRLRHGMFAVIILVIRQVQDTIVVPKTAVRTYNQENIVYVIDEEGFVRRTVVQTGLANDTYIQLVTGVSFGDSIVASGAVSDGSPVRIAERNTY